MRTSSRHRLLALLVLLLVAVSCAKRVGPPLKPGHDYLFPRWSRGEASPDESRQIHEAWRDVLSGKAAAAEKRFSKLLARNPGLFPARTGLGYAAVRARRYRDALRSFLGVLDARAQYVPALAGAGYASLMMGDADGALAFYRRAQTEDPNEPAVRRRLAQAKLQVTEASVAAGQEARGRGDNQAAVEAYLRALDAAPELGGLRVELADLLVGDGDPRRGLEVLDAAPGSDRQVLLRKGALLVDLQEYRKALQAYRSLLDLDPGDSEARSLANEARRALELASMPPEYRRIPSQPTVTRADLASLISVKVTALGRLGDGETRLAVDVSGSWARSHILRVLALEIMTVYPNHTFQPGATVRRGELASAVARVLDLLEWPDTPAPELRDMSRNNLFYRAACRAVSAGLMDVTTTGAFEAWRPVSGAQAVGIVEALARLVGP